MSLLVFLTGYLCLPSPDNIISVSEDDEAGDDRKKRPRTAFTAAQIKALESEFEKNKYLSVSKRMQLSKQLKLTETQVDIDINCDLRIFSKKKIPDQDLVSKSSHKVETEIHQ